MTPFMASELVGLFKVLANEGRLRLLHALRAEEELCVTALAEEVSMSVQAVSNQLQRLVAGKIVSARREGTFIHYRIADPCVMWLMDLGSCLVHQRRSPEGDGPWNSEGLPEQLASRGVAASAR